MTVQEINDAQLERLAVALARSGADLVRRERAAGVSVSVKSTSTDLVTQVDRASEHWLTEELARVRPHDAVLGEEGADLAGTSGVRWILDPIDGTVNFVLGIPLYAVSVAAERDGVVVAGAVCNPADGELFHARLGGGAFLEVDGADPLRLDGPRDVPLERAVVGTGFAYDRARRTRQARVAAALLAEVADVRRLGAAALDLCYVAAGRLDAHYEAGLNPWDFAAGGLVATEAGCAVSGLRGRAPSSAFYAAAGPILAPALFAALERHGADGVLDGDDQVSPAVR